MRGKLGCWLSAGVSRGQWLAPWGELQWEPVVMGAVSADPARTMKLVDEISALYVARFDQDAVFRMSIAACAGLDL